MSKELNKLLEQVTQEVTEILAKSEEPKKALAKVAPGEETPGEKAPAESSAAKSPEASSPPEGSPGEGPEGSPGDQPPADDGSLQDPATDQSTDPQALVAEYAKLPPEELKMHFMAAHEALMQSMGGGQENQGASPMPPEAPPAPEGTPPVGGSPVGKAEMTAGTGKKIPVSEGSGGMKKSETADMEPRLQNLEKSLKEKDDTIKEMQEQFGKVTEGLTKFLTKTVGLRKSITGISFDRKPVDDLEAKTLTKSEAIKRLNEITASPDLKKADRDLVNKYVLSGAPQSTIAHLLK